MIKRFAACAAFVCLSGLSLTAPAFAEDAKVEPVKRIPLQRIDFPPDKYATISTAVIVQPYGEIPRHTHPGIETGYLIEGSVTLKLGDAPEVVLKPGDSFLAPEGVPHGAKNGPGVAKIVSTFVVERTKPLATPAP